MTRRLRPYLKAVAPALLTLIAVLGEWVGTGKFDRVELSTALTGGLSALVTLTVRNRAAA